MECFVSPSSLLISAESGRDVDTDISLLNLIIDKNNKYIVCHI
jgi:hypothetical protein